MEIKKGDIIGIIGNVGSGKGTIIDFLKFHFNTRTEISDYFEDDNCNVINFADNLKQVVSYLFGVSLTYLYDRKAKDEFYYCFKNKALYIKEFAEKHNFTIVDNISVDLDHNLKFNNDNSNIYLFEDLLNRDDIVIKLRTFLQIFGTNICRGLFGNNIWINRTLDKLDGTKINIIGDVRFYDEYKAIIDFHCRGNKYFIKIVNTNPICKKYNHISETDMNSRIEKGLVKAHIVTWDGNNHHQLCEDIIKLIDKIEADGKTE